MKRILMTLALALPLAAVCVLPKSASAEPMNRDYNYNRQHDNIQRGNRDYNYNHQQDNERRNNRIYNRDRQLNSVQRYGNRRQRQWVAPHYERRNNILRWVLGRYIY